MNFYDEIRSRYGNIKRARGFYLYTEKNIRLLDMYLDGGMSILGRRENQAPLVFKQSIDKGLNAFLPSSGDYRLKKALNSLFPEHPYFYLLSEWNSALSFLEMRDNTTVSESSIGENIWKPFLPSSENLKSAKAFLVNPPFCTSIKIAVSKELFPIESCEISAAEKETLAKAFFDLIRIIKLREQEKNLSDEELITSACGKKKKEQLVKNIKSYRRVAELCSDFWNMEGPYLFSKLSEEKYEAFFKSALDSHILLSPYFTIPSILPKIRVYTELENFLKAQTQNKGLNNE
ncbi:hypothetical protein E4O05_04885 [Treponema sp. OMZ 787]|uniref:hypothetical protein n=1 Tax=Treponema sp. OMZ 787 TaxID=2563669 RepID=UPI0020A41164|nr:hypothetical protein [Treponema sp. OMZ 787]UTC63223.1 hypothetical protein E4O05_04885 [Treponema sp. OMZ 787]